MNAITKPDLSLGAVLANFAAMAALLFVLRHGGGAATLGLLAVPFFAGAAAASFGRRENRRRRMLVAAWAVLALMWVGWQQELRHARDAGATPGITARLGV